MQVYISKKESKPLKTAIEHATIQAKTREEKEILMKVYIRLINCEKKQKN